MEKEQKGGRGSAKERAVGRGHGRKVAQNNYSMVSRSYHVRKNGVKTAEYWDNGAKS